jgi:hypothetical protein
LSSLPINGPQLGSKVLSSHLALKVVTVKKPSLLSGVEGPENIFIIIFRPCTTDLNIVYFYIGFGPVS